MDIELVRGDITAAVVDAVVTAANQPLIGGGGVDGAVHRACGPELLRALRPLAPCPAGRAVVTRAFALEPRVRHVVHAVGPRYGVDEPAADLLASAYRAALARCDEVGAAGVAFPALSTGRSAILCSRPAASASRRFVPPRRRSGAASSSPSTNAPSSSGAGPWTRDGGWSPAIDAPMFA